VCVCDDIATVCLSLCLNFPSKKLQCICCAMIEQEDDDTKELLIDSYADDVIVVDDDEEDDDEDEQCLWILQLSVLHVVDC